ncbi:MAG: serine/threonine-protein kinase, partial [Planctomycetota bacterium]
MAQSPDQDQPTEGPGDQSDVPTEWIDSRPDGNDHADVDSTSPDSSSSDLTPQELSSSNSLGSDSFDFSVDDKGTEVTMDAPSAVVLSGSSDSNADTIQHDLQSNGAPVTASSNDELRPGSRVGEYTLLEPIGEGGMGSVWKAEQQEPIRRTVALKIVKNGAGTATVVERFLAERQALAMMRHPNIATALDAGMTPSGQPYFVMELVDGVPITRYCNDKRLTTSQRLRLFRDVCNAIQHAHQKSILHRDIKPGNVLVEEQEGVPIVKVIDFGLAKAIDDSAMDAVLGNKTIEGHIVGTPLYMSPEQADTNVIDIDTRTDVYSLGVLLYELLTSTTPIRRASIQRAAYAEVRRMICDETPPKPSSRLVSSDELVQSTAHSHRTRPAMMRSLLSGDLDIIVMKSLEKERERRFGSPAEFAADIERFLSNKPITARPPSTGYILKKWARRHRLLFASLAIVSASMVAATGISLIMAQRAWDAEQVAVSERDRAIASEEKTQLALQSERTALDAEQRQRQQAEFMSEFMISTLRSPSKRLNGRRITVASRLDAGLIQANQMMDNPARKATMLLTIGTTYDSLGLMREAEAP